MKSRSIFQQKWKNKTIEATKPSFTTSLDDYKGKFVKKDLKPIVKNSKYRSVKSKVMESLKKKDDIKIMAIAW